MSVNSLNDIWQAVLGVLGQNLTDTAISTWFEIASRSRSTAARLF